MRVEIAHDFGRRGKRHRRHHHRIALLDADGVEREVERGGAGVDGDGVRVSQEAREFLLELLDARSRGQPAALERGDDLVDLFRAEAGFVEGNFVHVEKLPVVRGQWSVVLAPRNMRPPVELHSRLAGDHD